MTNFQTFQHGIIYYNFNSDAYKKRDTPLVVSNFHKMSEIREHIRAPDKSNDYNFNSHTLAFDVKQFVDSYRLSRQ